MFKGFPCLTGEEDFVSARISHWSPKRLGARAIVGHWTRLNRVLRRVSPRAAVLTGVADPWSEKHQTGWRPACGPRAFGNDGESQETREDSPLSQMFR